MKIYHIAQTVPTDIPEGEEYMIENGILYNADGDDVFSIGELGSYNVPIFRSPEEANAFLEALGQTAGKPFGRVPTKDYLHDLRYKDTRKEREQANDQMRDERNQRWMRGKF